MKSYSVEAFVLRMRPLGEADRILTLFSRERGKLHAVAKGTRKTQSRFGGRLDFFNRVALELHTGRSLDTITGAHSVAGVWEKLVEPDAFALASYAAEVIDALSEPDLAVPDLYTLLCDLQAAIGAGLPVATLAPAVDLRLLGAMGLSPELDGCARCGSPLGTRPLAGGKCRLSQAAGGLVCRNCSAVDAQNLAGAAEGAALLATSAELSALRSLRYAQFEQLAEHPQIAALRRLTRPFVEYQLGRRSRALSVEDAKRRPGRRARAASR